MKENLKKTWRVASTSAGEVLLIVAGILIAFFLDAWWDDRIDRIEMREALQAVRLDFVSTKAELNTVQEANKIYVENASRLLILEINDVVNLDAADSLKLANLLPTGGLTFDPVLGSVDALISSGQLHKLRNVQLRSAITAWPALMDEIGEDHEILIDMYMAQQERSVQLGLYLLNLNTALIDQADHSFTELLSRVVGDPEMLNRIAAHIFAIEALGYELNSVEAHLDGIMNLLHQELNVDQTE